MLTKVSLSKIASLIVAWISG